MNSYNVSEIYEEYYHPQIISTETREPSPLDVYIPSLRIAFEYPPNHHLLYLSLSRGVDTSSWLID